VIGCREKLFSKGFDAIDGCFAFRLEEGRRKSIRKKLWSDGVRRVISQLCGKEDFSSKSGVRLEVGVEREVEWCSRGSFS